MLVDQADAVLGLEDVLELLLGLGAKDPVVTIRSIFEVEIVDIRNLLVLSRAANRFFIRVPAKLLLHILGLKPQSIDLLGRSRNRLAACFNWLLVQLFLPLLDDLFDFVFVLKRPDLVVL